MSENNQNNAQNAQQPVFQIVRIYSKDVSLETPNSPTVFQAAWKPELKVEFDSKTTKITDDQYEVCLRVTVTCKNGEHTAFLCEVNQAGVFMLRNLSAEAMDYLLGATAPNVLFPYAREFISSLVARATFPQLNLSPINFEALYRARKAQQAQEAQKAAQEKKDEPVA